jgi:hypothetical protein
VGIGIERPVLPGEQVICTPEVRSPVVPCSTFLPLEGLAVLTAPATRVTPDHAPSPLRGALPGVTFPPMPIDWGLVSMIAARCAYMILVSNCNIYARIPLPGMNNEPSFWVVRLR